VPPPLVFVVLVAAGVLVQVFVLPLPTGLPGAPRLAAGVALVALSFVVGLSAIRQFRRSGRQRLLPWHPSPELLARGFYRFSRNPMYVGESLQMVGMGLLADCAWVILAAPVFLLIVHRTAVVPEERYLAETFGEAYERYRARVRRYL